jgi:hypothetical protein
MRRCTLVPAATCIHSRKVEIRVRAESTTTMRPQTVVVSRGLLDRQTFRIRRQTAVAAGICRIGQKCRLLIHPDRVEWIAAVMLRHRGLRQVLRLEITGGRIHRAALVDRVQ